MVGGGHNDDVADMKGILPTWEKMRAIVHDGGNEHIIF